MMYEDRCHKVIGGMNTMEVSGAWSWWCRMKDIGGVSGGQVSGGERRESNEWDEWRCVINLNCTRHAYLASGHLTCYFFQGIIEQLF
jgi:hypothetical protein